MRVALSPSSAGRVALVCRVLESSGGTPGLEYCGDNLGVKYGNSPLKYISIK